VAERFKARVCGLSLAGIAGSNPADGMDVCVVCLSKRQEGKMQEIEKYKQAQIKY
jgi:hypothetical protein